jgi:hypothetical protein
MRPLNIRPVSSPATPGDFGGSVDKANSVLLLPEHIASFLASHGVHSASEFVSYTESFPSAIAAELDWSAADVVQALSKLRDQLRGHVDEAILNPPQRAKHVYGAFDPALLKNRPI